MKEYIVMIKQKIEYEATVSIEARSEEEALKEAERLYDDDVTVSEMDDSSIGYVFQKDYSI